MVIGRKQVIKSRKKEKMPRVEFDMEAIKEIKKRKKRSKRKEVNSSKVKPSRSRREGE